MILGTVELGVDYGVNNQSGKPSRKQAFDLLEAAWKGGVRELDTAAAYGEAEEIIGEYQELRSHRFQIDTKLSPFIDNDQLQAGFRLSCEKLRTEHIELLYLHSFEQCKNKKTISFLQELKNKGLIKSIGVSIYEPDEMRYIIEELQCVDVIQFPFNLMDNYRWRLLLNMPIERKIRLYARSIFLQGLLFKETNDPFVISLGADKYLLHLKEYAKKLELTMAELSILYACQQVGLADIIVGCQTKKDVVENLKIVKSEKLISDDVKSKIGELSELVPIDIIDPRRWKR